MASSISPSASDSSPDKIRKRQYRTHAKNPRTADIPPSKKKKAPVKLSSESSESDPSNRSDESSESDESDEISPPQHKGKHKNTSATAAPSKKSQNIVELSSDAEQTSDEAPPPPPRHKGKQKSTSITTAPSKKKKDTVELSSDEAPPPPLKSKHKSTKITAAPSKKKKHTVELNSDAELDSDAELSSDEASPSPPKSKHKSIKVTAAPSKKKSTVPSNVDKGSRSTKAPASQGKGKKKETKVPSASYKKKITVESSTDTESRPKKTPISQSKGKPKSIGALPAPQKKKKSAEELAVEARRSNPEGVRVIDRNIFDSAQVLAGYLVLPGTAELKNVLDSIKPLLKSFDKLRQQGFGIPDWSATSQVQVKVIFKTIREDSSKKVGGLRKASIPLNLEDRCFQRWDPLKQTFALAVYTATLFSILQAHPELFQEADELAEPTYVYYGHTTEDWYRAYALFRYGLQWLKKDKKLPSQDAIVPSYLSRQTAEAPETTVSEDPEQRLVAESMQADWADSDDFDNKTPIHPYEKEDVAEVIKTWDSGFSPEEEFTRFLEGKDKPVQPGVTVAREPLSQAQIARFLGSQGQKVKVLHDEFVDAIPLDNVAITGAENMITSLEEGEPHGEASTEFWDLRAKLSVVTGAMPSYADACKSLEYSLDEAAGEQLPIRHMEGRGTSSVVPNPWQVVAAAWMKIQEAGPIKGGLLALDCGLGKTISTLIHITKQAEIVEAQFQAGKAVDCRATLVLCPNSIVDVWYKEWRTFFRDVLYFRQFYGSVTDDLDIARKEITLPSNAKIARKEILKAFPPTSPKTARLLVVCSYETWGKRTLFASTVGEERRGLRERTTRTSAVLDTAPSTPGPNNLSKEESREMDLDLGPGVDTRHEDGQVFHSNVNRDTDTSFDESKVWTNVFKHCFRRAVCDEGHKLKNSRTRNHRAVFKTFAPCVWILSATPMLNSVADMLGYLNLFWQAEWDLDEDDMPETLVEIYTDTFRREFRELVPEYGSRFPRGYRKLDLFVLHPKHFATLHNRGYLQGTVAYSVLRPILALLQMRLSVAHQMDVNGRTVRVGDKIPMYRITTVELKMGSHEEMQYKIMWSAWSQLLSRQLNSTGGQFQPKPQADQKGLRNTRVHRHLSLCTFDFRLHALLTRSRKNLSAAVQTWYGKNLDHGASLYFRYTRPDPGLPNFADRWSLCEYICSMSPKLRYLCKILGEALYGAPTSRGKLLIFVTWPIEQWLVCCLLQNLGIDCMSVNSGMSAAEKARVTDRFDDESDPCPVLVCTFRGTAFGINLQRGCSKLLMMGFPENINTLLQTIGRIHRLGQQKVQEIWVVGTDHTYDQMLQAKAVKKMVVQMLGEADLEQLPVHDMARYKDNLRRLHGLDDDDDVDQILADVRDSHLLTQVDDRLTRLLGMRCSRLTWDSKRLYDKDGENTQRTPHRVRVVPVSDPLSSSSPRGQKRPHLAIEPPTESDASPIKRRRTRLDNSRLLLPAPGPVPTADSTEPTEEIDETENSDMQIDSPRPPDVRLGGANEEHAVSTIEPESNQNQITDADHKKDDRQQAISNLLNALTPRSSIEQDQGEHDKIEHNKTMKGENKQDKKKQDESMQDKTEQVETEQVETEQVETEQVETEQVETEQVETEQVETEQVEAEQDENEQDENEQDKGEQDESEQDEAEQNV